MRRGWIILVTVLPLLVVSCGTGLDIGQTVEERVYGDEKALVRELAVDTGDFRIVGDLRVPSDDADYPVVVMVHGDGPATRNGPVDFEPMLEIFLRQGYAAFSYDKPGSGESTGEFSEGHTISERASILADVVEALGEAPNIDPGGVGLWGISQAGWVMPMALELTDKVAFMISVSGGGEDGVEQMAYLLGQYAACQGGSAADVATAEATFPRIPSPENYADYRDAVETLLALPGIARFTGLSLQEEDSWGGAWPRDCDAFFDPTDVLEHTTIPVLAVFGELDKNVDPVQGAQAYTDALTAAGNNRFRVETIPGAGHGLSPAITGCIGEGGSGGYAPEYLELVDEWLAGLDP